MASDSAQHASSYSSLTNEEQYVLPFTGEEQRQQFNSEASTGPSGTIAFDDFFDLEGVSNLGFDPDFISNPDPFNFGENIIRGPDFGASTVESDLSNAAFLSSFELPDLYGPTEIASSAFIPAENYDSSLKFLVSENGCSILENILSPSVAVLQQCTDRTNQDATSVSGGSEAHRVLETRLGTTTMNTSGALSETHPEAEVPLPSVAPSDGSSSSSVTRRTRSARTRRNYTPYPDASQAHKAKEKGKNKAEKDIWRVITGPQPSPEANRDTAASGPSSSLITAGPSTSGSESGKHAGTRPGKRKEVFQQVEPLKGKPEWYNPPPPLKFDPKNFQVPPTKSMLPAGTHSDMGWVLARLREPDSGRAQYGWAVAQIHNPHTNAYLILSGPHQTQVKTVREYDRMPYSPENIAKLQQRTQGAKSGSRADKIYDRITVDPSTTLRLSSLYGTMHAFGGPLSGSWPKERT